MEATEDERSRGPSRREGCIDLRSEAEAAPLRQRIYRATRLLAAPGLWGSLVYPSGFGTLRRQFKSAQPHGARDMEKGPHGIEDGLRMAPEDGGPSVQFDLGPPREERAFEGRGRHDDPHGPRVPLPLGRRGRAEGVRDRRVANLPRVRGARPTGARPLPCTAGPRDLRGKQDR